MSIGFSLDSSQIEEKRRLAAERRDSESFGTFDSLAQALIEGVDFKRSVQLRNSALAIVSPHGGNLEPGVSEIARLLAQQNYSMYLFESLRPEEDISLHITSTRFNDRECLSITQKSALVVTVHGCRDDYEGIFVGGRNVVEKRALVEHLHERGFLAMVDRVFPGLHPENLCNRGALSEGGLQLELTAGVRRHFLSDEPGSQLFAASFIGAMSDFLEGLNIRAGLAHTKLPCNLPDQANTIEAMSPTL